MLDADKKEIKGIFKALCCIVFCVLALWFYITILAL